MMSANAEAKQSEPTSSAVNTAPAWDANAVAPSNVEGMPEIRLTKKAIEMAKKSIERRASATAGLRLGVRGGGCSGVSYAIEFADKIRARDHVFDFDGLSIVIDPKSLIYLRGSVLDYEVKLMQHGFKFRNPNEKTGCGCGESFTV